MKNILIIFSLISFPFLVFSQTDINIELQAYPTGFIPGLKLEKSIGTKTSIHFRAGYQFIDHRDLGVHMDESGDGYGISLGWNRYLKDQMKGWYLGARCDIWRNTIDWMDDGLIGQSKVTVLQPTIGMGHLLMLSDKFIITPTLSFGWEWNVETDGQPTGEGAIILVGIQMGRRF